MKLFGDRPKSAHVISPSPLIGQWRAGKRDGEGRLAFANGEVYTGQWSAGLRHGRGVFVRASGEVAHDGEWRRGKVVANSRTKL